MFQFSHINTNEGHHYRIEATLDLAKIYITDTNTTTGFNTDKLKVCFTALSLFLQGKFVYV